MIRLRDLFISKISLLCVLAGLAVSSATKADGPVQIDATNYNGPLCQFLIEKVNPAMQANENATFKVPTKEEVLANAPKFFDPSVVAKVNKTFSDPQGLGVLIDALAGQSFTVKSLPGLIANQLTAMKISASSIGLDSVSLAPFIGILSGAGVTVKWFQGVDSDEYGYKFDNESDAPTLAKDLKSGRGFGMAVDRQYLDASDSYILKSAQTYFKSGGENQKFYQTLFNIMTKMDTSGIPSLSPAGQALMVDFLTVFTAEFARSSMTEFKAHPWHKDLLAVFLVAPYVVQAQMISVGRKTQSGTLSNFFALGKSGSGIGETRNDREDLQGGITGVLIQDAASVQNIVQRIGTLIGKPDSKDIIQDSVDYLTNPDGQADVLKNSAQVVALMVDLETYLATDASDITNGLPGQLEQLPPRATHFSQAAGPPPAPPAAPAQKPGSN